MIIPLGVPVNLLNSSTVLTSSSSSTLPTFQLPLAATTYSVQAEIAEAWVSTGVVSITLNRGLDGTNYPFSTNVGGGTETSPWFLTMSSTAVAPLYYVQVVIGNTDSVDHTFDNLWVLFK